MSLNEACRTRRSAGLYAFPPRTETSRLIAAELAPDRFVDVEGSRLSGEVFFSGTTPPLRSARARGGVLERCIAGAGCATASGGVRMRRFGDSSSSSSSSSSSGGISSVASAWSRRDRSWGETASGVGGARTPDERAGAAAAVEEEFCRPVSVVVEIERRLGLVLASASSSIRPRGAIRRPFEEDRKSHMGSRPDPIDTRPLCRDESRGSREARESDRPCVRSTPRIRAGAAWTGSRARGQRSLNL